MDAYGNNGEYEGTLSALSRYGTLNTPSLKTARERKGKYRAGRREPRTRASYVGTVTVYHADRPDERYDVDPSFYAKDRASARKVDADAANNAAERRAQADHRLMLLARVAGNEQAL